MKYITIISFIIISIVLLVTFIESRSNDIADSIDALNTIRNVNKGINLKEFLKSIKSRPELQKSILSSSQKGKHKFQKYNLIKILILFVLNLKKVTTNELMTMIQNSTV